MTATITTSSHDLSLPQSEPGSALLTAPMSADKVNVIPEHHIVREKRKLDQEELSVVELLMVTKVKTSLLCVLMKLTFQ